MANKRLARATPSTLKPLQRSFNLKLVNFPKLHSKPLFVNTIPINVYQLYWQISSKFKIFEQFEVMYYDNYNGRYYHLDKYAFWLVKSNLT